MYVWYVCRMYIYIYTHVCIYIDNLKSGGSCVNHGII